MRTLFSVVIQRPKISGFKFSSVFCRSKPYQCINPPGGNVQFVAFRENQIKRDVWLVLEWDVERRWPTNVVSVITYHLCGASGFRDSIRTFVLQCNYFREKRFVGFRFPKTPKIIQLLFRRNWQHLTMPKYFDNFGDLDIICHLITVLLPNWPGKITIFHVNMNN